MVVVSRSLESLDSMADSLPRTYWKTISEPLKDTGEAQYVHLYLSKVDVLYADLTPYIVDQQGMIRDDVLICPVWLNTVYSFRNNGADIIVEPPGNSRARWSFSIWLYSSKSWVRETKELLRVHLANLMGSTKDRKFFGSTRAPSPEAVEQMRRLWEAYYSAYSLRGYRQFPEFTETFGLRLHNLPMSKEFAETDAEFQEAERRQFAILSALIKSGPATSGRLLVISSSYSGGQFRRLRESMLREFLPQASFWQSVPIDLQNPKYQLWQHVFVSEIDVSDTGLKALLRLIVDEKPVDMVIMSPAVDWWMQPYHGGNDICSVDENTIDTLLHDFEDWLPAPRDN